MSILPGHWATIQVSLGGGNARVTYRVEGYYEYVYLTFNRDGYVRTDWGSGEREVEYYAPPRECSWDEGTCQFKSLANYPTRVIVRAPMPATQIVYSTAQPDGWRTLINACLDTSKLFMTCEQRTDWAWELTLPNTTVFLDNVSWSGLTPSTRGQPYSAKLTNPLSAYYRTSISNLPAGMKFDSSTNTLFGTPTVAGRTVIRLKLYEESGGRTVSVRSLPFTVSAPVPTIVTTTFDLLGTPPATVGKSFNRPIVFNSYGEKATVSATGLPPGITVQPNGSAIVGAPTRAGAFSVVLSVKTADGIATRTISLTVRG